MTSQFIDQGEGPAIIFVHGLPGQAKDFSPLIDVLASDFRCIAYNRGGYGHAYGKPGIAHGVAELFDLLDEFELKEVSVAGWSYGGHIAMAAAAAQPDRISSLILMGSAGPTFRWPGSTADALLFKTPLGLPLFRLLHRFGPQAFRPQLNDAYGKVAPEDLIQDFWNLMSDKSTVGHWISEGKIWQPETAPAKGVEQSTLIIHGEADTRVPAQIALELARLIPNSTLKLLPNAGHWPFASHTQIVASEIKTFLQTKLPKVASLA